MAWIPEDASFLTVLGALLAIATALLGVATGLGQLTGAGRARRTIEWTSAAIAAEADAGRKDALTRLRASSHGYLLAARYVPWWRFANVAMWVLVSPLLVTTAADADDGAAGYVYRIVGGALVLWLSIRRAIRLYSERVRVAHHYEAGGIEIAVPKLDLLDQMEGGTRREYLIAGLAAITVMVTAVGAALVLTTENNGTALALAIAGGFGIANGLQGIHAYALNRAKLLLEDRGTAETPG